jgi:hypothetical protein
MIDRSYYTLPMAMFYTRLNQLLREQGFDDFAEARILRTVKP